MKASIALLSLPWAVTASAVIARNDHHLGIRQATVPNPCTGSPDGFLVQVCCQTGLVGCVHIDACSVGSIIWCCNVGCSVFDSHKYSLRGIDCNISYDNCGNIDCNISYDNCGDIDCNISYDNCGNIDCNISYDNCGDIDCNISYNSLSFTAVPSQATICNN
ncbi:hypothetical protein BKA67DRAFT_651910 [Truncatella angustata]|uniref:Hydrophobin n=1 Tax=Truncatella angustata TaxID=152316 RepID=A0A9P8REI7_9PEZI|nr:uncharacterized protein BKA67DRAFT_651910 [Truncatella angustata]KAH6639999.1 hypothetical protein BKA67DRAFT_651910 [Truncatella angustata]KAH8194348.1 hypothetical protein TruAng_011486 [Truncatella angustata]